MRRDRRASLRGVSDAIQISGRSPSAWLSAPFAPATARTSENPYTAQQLAAEALTINGVPMGWALDWRIPDWLVPAGAWSHLGTPMEAVLRIAEAGGGYIQAAAATQTLRALPHYPAAPWLWASLTPDLILPDDVVEVEGTETAGGAFVAYGSVLDNVSSDPTTVMPDSNCSSPARPSRRISWSSTISTRTSGCFFTT